MSSLDKFTFRPLDVRRANLTAWLGLELCVPLPSDVRAAFFEGFCP